jgi:hypothetical protein
VASVTSVVAAPVVSNGSFEQHGLAIPGIVNYGLDSSGWDTTGSTPASGATFNSNINIQNTTTGIYNSLDGDFALRILNGNAVAKQVISGFDATGYGYRLSFWSLGDTAKVSLTNAIAPYFGITGQPFAASETFASAGLWTQHFIDFRATSAAVTLSFTGATGNGYTYIDNVSVTAVPEPESYAMLLAGLGAIGFMSRRRRQA